MASQSANRSQPEILYGRLGIMFLAIFSVNALSAFLPPRLADIRWQLALAQALRDAAPLAILGVALLFLAPFVRTGKLDGSDYPLQRRIRTLAPYAALGFFLLIPLQINASWMQLRQADVQSQRTLRTIERRLDQFRNATSNAELQQLTRGLPAALQPEPQNALNANQQRLLANFEPRLESVRAQTRARKRQAMANRSMAVFHESLICAAYGLGFLAMRRDPTHLSTAKKQVGGHSKPASWVKFQRRLKRLRRSLTGRPLRP